MIRALFLDLDGTIADTIDAIREAVNMTVKYFHVKYLKTIV